ncbi:MAG: hypothetical protein ABWX74_20990 [Aeromicrobium sp.]
MVVRRLIQTDDQVQATAAPGTRTVDVAATRSVLRNRGIVRSAELVDAVQRLDTTTDPATAEAIMQWINDEYESRSGGQIIGLFGRCYLGHPFVDHRIDLAGAFILQHFTRDETPPGPYGAARPFARNTAYTFIEVYDDGSVIPIRADGRPVI